MKKWSRSTNPLKHFLEKIVLVYIKYYSLTLQDVLLTEPVFFQSTWCFNWSLLLKYELIFTMYKLRVLLIARPAQNCAQFQTTVISIFLAVFCRLLRKHIVIYEPQSSVSWWFLLCTETADQVVLWLVTPNRPVLWDARDPWYVVPCDLSAVPSEITKLVYSEISENCLINVIK